MGESEPRRAEPPRGDLAAPRSSLVVLSIVAGPARASVSVAPRPVPGSHLRLGELEGGFVRGELDMAVHGIQRLRSAPEQGRCLLEAVPVELLGPFLGAGGVRLTDQLVEAAVELGVCGPARKPQS